jgi:hypothetical protein
LCIHLLQAGPGGYDIRDEAGRWTDRLPVYQDSFYRLGSMAPEMGFRLYPINMAFRISLEFLYWKCPDRRRHDIAA